MDLNFELQGGYFIAEFEVTSDFNLHIEKDPIGQFIVYQRTAGGAYDLVADFGKNKGDDSVIDYDFQALVYPKWIKIKSSVKPLVATITTDGEVNEVVYQAKDIEITSNSTTKVTADTGYTALASVNVKVNVPTNGGSTHTELKRNDINFFDYDGTLLYAYTWDEAKELPELPPLPTHDNLEVREWNYTLEDIKKQGTDTTIGKADIGACCYDSEGNLVVANGTYIIPRGVTVLDYNTPHIMPTYGMAKIFSVPATIKSVDYNFSLFVLEHLVMPIGIEYQTYYGNAFAPTVTESVWINGQGLDSVIIDNISGMGIVRIPNTFSTIRDYWDSFKGAGVIYFPETIHTIENLKHGSNWLIFDKHTFVPTLNSTQNSSDEGRIIVPDNLYEEWSQATNWSLLNVVRISEFPYLNK